MKILYLVSLLLVLAFVCVFIPMAVGAADNTSEVQLADALKKAESGDSESQFVLAGMYFEGKGAAADHKKAFEWCEKSALQGYEIALFRLGGMYYQGNGAARDHKKAYAYLTIAVAGLEEILLKTSAAEKATTKANLGTCHFMASDLIKKISKSMSREEIAEARQLSESIRERIKKNAPPKK